MTDPTEAARRELIPQMPAELQERVKAGEQVWDTEQLREDFEVESYSAPFVVARKKSNGRLGSLQFTHSPRYYFAWKEH